MFLSRVSLLRTGVAGRRSGASRVSVALLLSASAIAMGGCSSTGASPTSGLFGGLVAATNEPEPERKPSAPVDLEGDGHEAQRPPPMRMYRKDDDPTQPFSPSYGEVPLPQPEGDDQDAAAAPA
ncbi:MAG: hypothetical protein ABI457_08370 [Hyphomicrobium sp.]